MSGKVSKHFTNFATSMNIMKSKIVILILAVLIVCGCSAEQTSDEYKVWGVDISKHQKGVDWQEVCLKNRPDFVFIKATEGTLIIDPTYERHAKELTEQGVLWGAYHFFGHRTSGKEQARSFIKTSKLAKGNLIPVLDIEKHRFMKDPKRSVREAKAFCSEIKRYYGVNPIIYCSTLFYEHYLKSSFKEGDYVLWIADYRGRPKDLQWHFWQHTDSHSIEGIAGAVDRNVFDKSIEELNKLTLR